MIQISLKFVPRGPIDSKFGLVQVMAWHRIGKGEQIFITIIIIIVVIVIIIIIVTALELLYLLSSLLYYYFH